MNYCILNVGQNFRLVGGSDRYMIELGKLLQKHGHRVIPFAAKDMENLETEDDSYFPRGADFTNPGLIDILLYIYSLPAKSSIRKIIRDRKIDIAHLHIYYGKLTTSILSPLVDSNIPIVQTCHDLKLLCPVSTLYRKGTICEDCKGKKWYNAMLNKCNRGSVARSSLSMLEAYFSNWNGSIDKINQFIAVSHFLKDKMIEHGIDKSKICVIHNYIDTNQLKVRSATGEYLLYFGRIERYKGIFTLLRAAKNAPEIRLIIAGRGSDFSKVKEYINTNALKNVDLIGFIQPENLAPLIEGAICTVCPSELHETFGLSVIESFAYGKPVLASRIGGIPEIVDNGGTGFLFDAGNAADLKGLMKWMWMNRRKAKTMGICARKHVEKAFSPDAHYKKLMKIYSQYD